MLDQIEIQNQGRDLFNCATHPSHHAQQLLSSSLHRQRLSTWLSQRAEVRFFSYGKCYMSAVEFEDLNSFFFSFFFNKQKNLLVLFIHIFTNPSRGKAKCQGATDIPQAPTCIHWEKTCSLPHIHMGTHGHEHTSTHIPQVDLQLWDEMRGPGTFQLASLEQSLTELGSKQNLQLRPLPALLPPWGSTILPGFHLSIHTSKTEL